MSDLFAEYSAK